MKITFTTLPAYLRRHIFYNFPAVHRRLIRTTNGLERLNREIARRSRIVAIFPNEASCLRLVTAIVMETSEEWVTGRTYIRVNAA